jgi:hypothetical protein
MIKYAVEMQLPQDKRPGFYAQIVKGIAEKTALWDRDKELLILNSEADRNAVVEVLEHYNVPCEFLELTLLPQSVELTPQFEDYGFSSRSEYHYAYSHLISIFQLIKGTAAESGPDQALLQMEEHVLARYHDEHGSKWYIVDNNFEELMEGIAKAYHCEVAWA